MSYNRLQDVNLYLAAIFLVNEQPVFIKVYNYLKHMSKVESFLEEKEWMSDITNLLSNCAFYDFYR